MFSGALCRDVTKVRFGCVKFVQIPDTSTLYGGNSLMNTIGRLAIAKSW